MTSLSLSNWPLLLGQGRSPSECLPILLHLAAHLPISLVQGFADLEHIQFLKVALSDTIARNDSTSQDVMISRSSQLRVLHLVQYEQTPVHNRIVLRLLKPDLQLRCFGLPVDIQSTATTPYKLPSKFMEFDWLNY